VKGKDEKRRPKNETHQTNNHHHQPTQKPKNRRIRSDIKQTPPKHESRRKSKPQVTMKQKKKEKRQVSKGKS